MTQNRNFGDSVQTINNSIINRVIKNILYIYTQYANNKRKKCYFHLCKTHTARTIRYRFNRNTLWLELSQFLGEWKPVLLRNQPCPLYKYIPIFCILANCRRKIVIPNNNFDFIIFCVCARLPNDRIYVSNNYNLFVFCG